jgi:hypothetical protein
MPTNVLRNAPRRTRPAADGCRGVGPREIEITAGGVTIRAVLADTATADRLWAALPLFSTAETWGQSLHFEVPIESGRERGARQLGELGEIYYWSDDDRVLIVFGPTPISRANEIRLPRPCNVLARTSDDVSALKPVTPGEKVRVRRALSSD